MLIERACEITGIRVNELSRINAAVLKDIIRSEKANAESDYILHRYSKAEYVEAYETILAAAENN